MQAIAQFLKRTDDYQLDPAVSGVNAFLLRGVRNYYESIGGIVCDDLNKMVFLDNPQYPGGFIPKGKTAVVCHIQAAFLCFGLRMDGTGNDGIRDGACGALLGCALLFGSCVRHNRFCLKVCFSDHVFDITGFSCRLASWGAHEDQRSQAPYTPRVVLP